MIATVLALVPLGERACALGPDNVVVLYNAAEGPTGEGYQIASYYQQQRPGVHLLGLRGISAIYSGDDTTSISATNYLSVIRPQVLSGIHDIEQATGSSIDVIVTTKGLPLRITAGGTWDDTAQKWIPPAGMSSSDWEPYSSLESELARVDTIDSVQKMGDQAILHGFPDWDTSLGSNPYFNTGAPFNRASPSNGGIRLAARLDGFSVQTVKATIDRAQKAFVVPLPYGPTIVMDDHPNGLEDQMTDNWGLGPGLKAVADDWQQTAEARLAQLLHQPGYTFPVPFGMYDNTTASLTMAPGPVIGYVSHGVHGSFGGNPDYIENQLDFQLANGAVFLTHESHNAYSFDADFADNPDPAHSNSSGLIAQWLEVGGTAGLGHVAEPRNGPDNVTNEDLLFQMLLPPADAAPGTPGLTFVEAAWNATRQLSYVNTVVGDPLMRFRLPILGDTDLDGDVDMVDLLNVKNCFGRNNGGDADHDGDTDLDDFLMVRNHLMSLPPGAGAGAVMAAVPEPSAVVLLVLGALASLAARRV